MWLRTSAGTYIQISAVELRTAHQRVHNLTVATHHTYYVLAGAVPVLAHNCGEDGSAEVYLAANGRHVSIAVTYNGRTIHSEAGSEVGLDSIPSMRTALHLPGTTVFTIPLPRARNAQFAQEAMDGFNLGRHDELYNNCVTYCARILRAGGADIDVSPEMGSQNIIGRLFNSSLPRRTL